MAEAVLALADNSEQGTGIYEAHATALLIILLKRNRIHMPSELAAHREQVRMQADITDAVKMAASPLVPVPVISTEVRSTRASTICDAMVRFQISS